MVILTTAFDVSEDQPNRKFLVMAGFVSDARRWVEFDGAWRARLAIDGLPYFHSNPFAQAQKPFRGWDKQPERGRRLLEDLVGIIIEHAYQKFGVVVQAQAAESLSNTQQRRVTMIATAGSIIVGHVESWRVREKYRLKPEYIFEDGDRDKGTLEAAVRKAAGTRPIFRLKKDNPNEGIVAFTPLQAADLFAYLLKKVVDADGPLPFDYRFHTPYAELDKKLEQPFVFNLESAQSISSLLEADQYFRDNPLVPRKPGRMMS